MNGIAKPKEFVLKISKCGLDSIHAGYDILKGKDGLEIAVQGVNIIANGFARGSEATFEYMLGLKLISRMNLKERDLEKDLEMIKTVKFCLDDEKESANLSEVKDETNN